MIPATTYTKESLQNMQHQTNEIKSVDTYLNICTTMLALSSVAPES
jgi:hypothetical protein